MRTHECVRRHYTPKSGTNAMVPRILALFLSVFDLPRHAVAGRDQQKMEVPMSWLALPSYTAPSI
jgi:hypothetical protein